jgi:hypothetical protein
VIDVSGVLLPLGPTPERPPRAAADAADALSPPSTPKNQNNHQTGIMDHEEARRKGLGGKVLGFFY